MRPISPSNPVVGKGKVVGVVNLDMPILTYDFQDVVAFGAEHSTIGSAVARAIASEGLKLSPDPEPEQVGFVRTDHYPFVKAGVPGGLARYRAGRSRRQSGRATSSTSTITRPSDDMKLPFNWGAAAKFAQINYLVARELADAAEPPRWYDGDFFGDTFAKDAPKAKRADPLVLLKGNTISVAT